MFKTLGIRIHLTKFAREKPPVPSVFTMKLRKLLRTKRLEYAEQQALDRVLVLAFGSGDSLVRVVLEFYAAGNIVLLDRHNTILALARSYEYALPAAAAADGAADDAAEPTTARVAVGERYPFDATVRETSSVSAEQLAEIVARGVELEQQFAAGGQQPAAGGKKQKKRKAPTLRDVLNDELDLGPRLIQHCVLQAGFGNRSPPSAAKEAEAQKKLSNAINEVTKRLFSSTFVCVFFFFKWNVRFCFCISYFCVFIFFFVC